MFITSVLGVPVDGSGRLNGCERAPQAYRDAGLIAALNVPDLGDLPVTLNDPTRDPETGIIGIQQLLTASNQIRKSLSELFKSGERPLVIGGDCSLLIGIGAALADVYGRVGLAFIDGHIDYYDGRTSPTGEPADMELAIITGEGPAPLSTIAGDNPLFFPSDVTALGVRDLADARAHGARDPHSAIRIFEFDPAQSIDDIADMGRQTAARFAAEPGRFWLHLDFDVLGVSSMPAVDYLMTGGFDWEQLRRLVRPMVQSPAFLGMDVTIYNPTLDTDGSGARNIVAFLSDVLA